MRPPLILTVLLFSAAATAADAAGNGEISFNRDIRPILSDKCFACHGFDKNTREADLRLDTEAGSRDAIVPGKRGESELWHRIIETDPDDLMPPPKSEKHLTKAEIDLLGRWIDSGAAYEAHWAYLKPAREPDAPKGHAAIDFYVGRELARRGIKPSPPADRRTQLRRLSFDLTGLPPDPKAVEAFLADPSADAYERAVDGLLASQHYGERMAIEWLDVVRYADTVGFHGDQPVSVSPYRDYVIKAFNENLPFDQFTREQIAGDLLPDAGDREKIASGYNRLNMTTEEGGSQPKEYLAKYAADRVRTTSVAWLGATFGCAECHDHKFDPYTMEDFYSFAAFFADIEEVGVYGNRGRPPEMVVRSPEEEKALAEAGAEVARLEGELAKPNPAVEAGQAKWEAEIRAELEGGAAEPFDFVYIEDEPPAGAKLSGAWKPVRKSEGANVFSGESAREQIADAGVQHYFNLAEPVAIQEGDKFFVHVWLDPQNPPAEIMLQAHSKDHGTWNHRAFWGEDKIAYGGIGTDQPDHRPMGPLPKAGEWVRLEVDAAHVGIPAGKAIDGFSFDQFGGRVLWDQAGVRFASGSPRLRALPAPVREAFAAGEPTDAQRKAVADHYRGAAPELAPLRDQLAAAKAKRDGLAKSGTKTLITVAAKPREMRVLPRGDWMDQSGAVVSPQIPAFLGELPVPEEARLSRLDLANWLVSRDNPLTARVFVNRLWKRFFGTGFSKVLDDLGSQGEAPVHPDLLDALAVDFMESGWDMKALVKAIVMSDAYRRSSESRPELRDADPNNRLLARQRRLRLPAELIRDNALAISGLLNPAIGGVSAKPYQPDGYYEHLNFPRRKYEEDKDANQWRRGLYTHWQRTFLHPMLLAFDAPSRDECAADRPVSNTPTQALVMLNDPTFVEAARAFAARIVREGGASPEDRVAFALREALARPPSDDERAVLLALHREQAAAFQADPAAAEQYTGVGIAPKPEGLDPAEHAAWTSVARAILNLNEMLVRY